MSIVTFEKPCEHVSLADWHGQLWELRQTASTRQKDAYRLRNESMQMRSEAAAQSRWSAFHNTMRLADRVTEVQRWKEMLESCLGRVRQEIAKLKAEKDDTDRMLEKTVNMPLARVSDSLRTRDGRRGNDLNHDQGYVELRNELAVIESLTSSLKIKVMTAWEQINRLREVEFKLELDLDNKDVALAVDRANLELDESNSGNSYKPDALRVPASCVPYEGWLNQSRYNTLAADNEITASMKLREAMYCTRERADNDLRAQMSATDQALRRRIYETRRVKTELEWQRVKMMTELEKMEREVEALEVSVKDKTDTMKLAQSRLEARLFRPSAELVYDEPQAALGDQVLQLRQTRSELQRQLAAAKATFNAMQAVMGRIDNDLANKEHALAVDLACQEARDAIAKSGQKEIPETQTDKNIKLTRMEQDIPAS